MTRNKILIFGSYKTFYSSSKIQRCNKFYNSKPLNKVDKVTSYTTLLSNTLEIWTTEKPSTSQHSWEGHPLHYLVMPSFFYPFWDTKHPSLRIRSFLNFHSSLPSFCRAHESSGIVHSAWSLRIALPQPNDQPSRGHCSFRGWTRQ